MNQRGLTLLELMITLAVAGVLFALAAPNFRTMVQNNRITTQVNEFVTATTYARSEAIRRGGSVTLCRSIDQATCAEDGDDWADGWAVMEGTPGDYGEVLRVWDALTGDPDMVEQAGENVVVFEGNGAVDRSLDIRHNIPACSGDQARRIRLDRTGRTNVTRQECNP
ncbi:type IV fimbrial biogenesis protein FimT [Natronospira proteinivora]|uniref:Type II secretion system protein H n=1 Tax=Natronospira proteinivora TaxID=1807133 RepID=A0ABT1G4Q6_9GAMM|nr:GspH/FimT family pseudopilin [Natronospira proteinivora]MCP1726270.1 type IV fimbrial biogenesis protein FimT [Natronospira proteinivora]